MARKVSDLNALADQAAADCPLDQANELEAAVENFEQANNTLDGCFMVPDCVVGIAADDYGEALEELRRAVLAG